jgi:hypothetical protein
MGVMLRSCLHDPIFLHRAQRGRAARATILP